jgi:hypothetical protein
MYITGIECMALRIRAEMGTTECPESVIVTLKSPRSVGVQRQRFGTLSPSPLQLQIMYVYSMPQGLLMLLDCSDTTGRAVCAAFSG